MFRKVQIYSFAKVAGFQNKIAVSYNHGLVVVLTINLVDKAVKRRKFRIMMWKFENDSKVNVDIYR